MIDKQRFEAAYQRQWPSTTPVAPIGDAPIYLEPVTDTADRVPQQFGDWARQEHDAGQL